MRIQFVGCGDAFGTGGRFNTCFHLVGEQTNLLIDCGASSMVALKRCAIDRNLIDTILLTHFHADHFGGIPFFILDAQFVSKRTHPLTLVGPPGLRDWYVRAMETAFPGSSTTQHKFDLSLREVASGQAVEIGSVRATPFHVRHDDRAGPCLAYRLEVEGRVIAFSGDTEWTETLIEVGREADLFICEAYARDRVIRAHMSLALLERHLPEIRPQRLVLTHLSEEMFAYAGKLPYQTAEDGLIIEL
jgi:ribonuclease BN (tRNA processing enzyme)